MLIQVKKKISKKIEKKGLSVMIGYVLLITSAVVMGSIVYIWLESYVPREVPQCPEGVSIAVIESSCVNGNISLRLKNNGLYNIDGLLVRGSSRPGQEIATIDLTNEIDGGFIKPGGTGGLAPGEEDMIRNLSYNSKICDAGVSCEEKNVCLGNNLCPSLNHERCDASKNGEYPFTQKYDCDWIGSIDEGKCVGTATCQDVVTFGSGGNDCNYLSTDLLKICEGWKSVNYYNITSVEITPLVYIKQNNKNRIVTCGNAKIQENFKNCILFKEKTSPI